MERLLTTLERRIGRYAPANLIWWIVGLTGLAYAMIFVKPEILDSFTLDPAAVRGGEVWRLVTFLFLPWSMGSGVLGPIWTLFALMFLYTIGSSLESEWGAFRFDAFYAFAVLATIASALLFGPVTNFYINQALLLAFAITFPDYEILLFLILPVKMKWLGLLEGVLLAYQFITGAANVRAGIVAAVVVLLVFCGSALRARLSGTARGVATNRRRTKVESAFAPAPVKARVCALCGKSSTDDPNLEFRLCDCQEKCHGKLTEYCLEHARNH